MCGRLAHISMILINKLDNTFKSSAIVSPSLFSLMVVAAIGLLLLLPKHHYTTSQPLAVGYSVLAVSSIWFGLIPLLCRRKYEGRFAYRHITTLLVVKLTLSILYFYLLFLPATDFALVPGADMTDSSIDVIAIHTSAVIFKKNFTTGGMFHAIFGDYYRNINNPGVNVLFGLLYTTFGEFPGVAIPWNVLCMGISGLIVAATCLKLSYTRREVLTCVYMTILMPSFLVLNPLYRDQFMVMLILLLVYSFSCSIRKIDLSTMATIFLASGLLTCLRLSFAGLSGAIFVSYILFRKNIKLLKIIFILLIFSGFILVLTSYTGINLIPQLLDVKGVQSTIHSLLGSNPISNAIFLIFTPFPWYQSISSTMLVYQFPDYPQVLFALSIYFSIWLGRKQLIQNRFHRFFLLSFIFYFLAVINFSALHQRYLYVALPMLIICASPIILRTWQTCVGLSFALLVFAHLFYEIARVVLQR